jgi:hypothetical protein
MDLNGRRFSSLFERDLFRKTGTRFSGSCSKRRQNKIRATQAPPSLRKPFDCRTKSPR